MYPGETFTQLLFQLYREKDKKQFKYEQNLKEEQFMITIKRIPTKDRKDMPHGN